MEPAGRRRPGSPRDAAAIVVRDGRHHRSRSAGPSSGLANQPSEYAAVSALSTEAGEQPFTISLPLELTFHFAGEG